MSTICRIVFGLLLWANLFSISYPPDVAAFPPSDIPDTLDAELELLLPEMIPTGAAFRATFTVTVNQPIKHLNDEPDKVGIAIPRCCIVDSGSCEWRGILDKGVSVSLTVILRAQSSCVDYFEGYVKASCYQQEPVTYATMVRTVSREYRISAEPVSKPQSTMDSTIGIHVVDTVSTGVPQSVAVKDWRKRIRQNDQYVSVDSLKTGRATVFYIAGSDNCVGITDSLQDRANRRQPLLRAEFRCPTAGIGLKRLIGGAVRIDMKDGIDEATIEVTIDKELYHLKVVRRSSSMVSGQFRWINNYGSEVGGSGILVELYHADGGGWVLDDAQLTSTEGQFQLYTDFVDVRLEFWSWNDAAILPYKAQGCWLPTDPFVFYVRRLDFSLWAPGGVNEIPPVNTTVTNLDWAGAFNICHFMQLGASFVDYAFGDPGYVCVVWGRNCNDVRFSYYSPWTYVDLSFWGIQEDAYVLQIASRGSGEDWDEWDEHVLLHEYGHHFQNMFVDHSDSSSAVVHYYWAPTDEQGVVQEHLALNEGMANVFQAVVLSSGQLIDHDNQNDPILNYNFELPQPDAPYCVCTNGYQEIPSALDPIWPGASTEGAIVAAFWDMCDLDNDGNYFNLGDLWGHNNDHNASSSWLGYESLFDAYLNYDPSPADPDHDHAWDMDEIIIAWQQLGYPIDNAFLDNLAAHGIQLCNWLVGDADGSGRYSIDDAVFLIAYQFGDGPAPAPHPKGSGDCDCSGLVSISDAVYMINYIFAGGPPPSAVCDCQDFLSGIYSKVD